MLIFKFLFLFFFLFNSIFSSFFRLFGKKNEKKNIFLEKIKNYKINKSNIDDLYFWNNIILELTEIKENKEKKYDYDFIKTYSLALGKEFKYVSQIKDDDEFLNYLNNCYKYLFIGDEAEKDNIFYNFLKDFLNFIINDKIYEFSKINEFDYLDRIIILESYVFKYLSYLVAYNFYSINIKDNLELKIDYLMNEIEFKEFLEGLLKKNKDTFISKFFEEYEYKKYYKIYLDYLYKITIANKPENDENDKNEEIINLQPEVKKEEININKNPETENINLFKNNNDENQIKNINLKKELEIKKKEIKKEELLKVNEKIIEENNKNIFDFLKKEEDLVLNKKILDVFKIIENRIEKLNKNIKDKNNPFYFYLENLKNLYSSFKNFVINKIQNELNLNLNYTLSFSLIDFEKIIENKIENIEMNPIYFTKVEKEYAKIDDKKKTDNEFKKLIENYSLVNKIESSIKTVINFSKNQLNKIKSPFYKIKDYFKSYLDQEKKEFEEIKIKNS